MDSITRKKYVEYGLEMICAFLLFLFAYRIGFFGIDYNVHGGIAERFSPHSLRDLVEYLRVQYYPFWHISTKIWMKVFQSSLAAAGGCISGLCCAVAFLAVCEFFKKNDIKPNKVLAIICAFLLFIVMGLYLPWYNLEIYAEQGSPNVWHNPTQIAVRPFGTIAFLLIAQQVSRIRKEQWEPNLQLKPAIGIGILLIFANLAKPSFAQILYPALFLMEIWYLIVSRGKALKMGVQLALACFPSLLVMLAQFLLLSKELDGSGGIVLSFLGFWRATTRNIPLAFVMVTAFPLLMAARDLWKRHFSPDTLLAWLMFFCGCIEKAFLAEAGPRFLDGNFSWGYNLGLFFIWLVSLKEYLAECREEKSPKIHLVAATIVLLGHVIAGMIHLYRMLVLKHGM